MKKIFLFLLVSSLFLISCKKESSNLDLPPIENNRNFVEINTSVSGRILDRSNQPIENAFVSFGQEETQTDGNGIFKIDDVDFLENRALVKVRKDGYFDGSRTFFAFANQRSFVEIKLLEKTIQGSVNVEGGIITLSEGVKLNFPNNAFTNLDGSSYNGNVDVVAQYLDPKADDINQIMPGDLRGISQENNEEGLTTFGMVAVELLGSGGEELNIADGKKVELTMPIPSSQLNNAPAEIPLWYFDEDQGVWKEEGSATLEGGEYVGEVTHFTFWNCDYGWEMIYLKGNLSLDQNPMVGAKVELIYNDGNSESKGYSTTNEQGQFAGYVPANSSLTLNILPSGNNCSTSIFTKEIGPFNFDTDLDPMVIDETTISDNYFTIKGSVVDCANNQATNSYLKIVAGSSVYYAHSSDGNFDVPILYCENILNVELTIIDLNALTQSDPIIYPIFNVIDFVELASCGQLEQYIIYEFNGETIILTEGLRIKNVYNSTDQKLVKSGPGNNYAQFVMETEGQSVGTHEVVYLMGSNNLDGFNPYNDPEVDITFEEYSSVVGEVCKGYFEGIVAKNGIDIPISGTFRLVRATQ